MTRIYDQDATVIDLTGRTSKACQQIVDDDLVEHSIVHELRTTVTHRGEWNEHSMTQHRFVCSCGVVTGWHRRWLQARRKMDRHALPGQLAARRL